jgi:hypothetical protein
MWGGGVGRRCGEQVWGGASALTTPFMELCLEGTVGGGELCMARMLLFGRGELAAQVTAIYGKGGGRGGLRMVG